MNFGGNILVTSARNTDIGIESLAGFVNRSFILSEILIPDSYVKSQMGFALGVHAQKDGSALVEVKYRIIEHVNTLNQNISWKNIPEKIWRKFFDMYRTSIKGMIESEEPWTESDAKCHELCLKLKDGLMTLSDGKTPCFKIELGDYKKLSAKQMLCCPIVTFMKLWRVQFPMFIKYGDKVSNMEDFNELVIAFNGISDVMYSIKMGNYKTKKQAAIHKLKRYEEYLMTLEDNLSKIYEGAASAMNELADNFGIEIDLDNHCCENVK